MMPGIIFCGWGTHDLVARSLTPWIELRRQGKCKICAVSVRFAGFEGDDDGTRQYLIDAFERGEIDHIIDEPDNIPETKARGMALQCLKEYGCDIVWQVDSDEFYTENQIQDILRFVEQSPWTVWFRLSLKNLVFDSRTYLVEPFTPPRIHRIVSGSYKAHSFSGDNDIAYGGTITRDIISQDNFPSQTIPKQLAWISHYTWTTDTPESAARSKAKEKYQRDRGWRCSFVWDDSKGGLIFNPSLPQPKVIRE